MRLADLATPCLVLDRDVLRANLERMAGAVRARGLALRPHLKTAKSVEVARLATQGQAGGLTVSTLAEAEAFAAAGFTDLLYAVGIAPSKLPRAAAIAADLKLVTDDPDAARAIAAFLDANDTRLRVLVEVDSGEGRGGIAPDSDALVAIGTALGRHCVGVMTHAGHSYATRSPAEAARLARTEIEAASLAVSRLRALGLAAPIVSVGSTPTVLHGTGDIRLATEARPGVYMFSDLFQASIEGRPRQGIALCVLASVIGRRAHEHRFLIDAGSIALSKDRSTEATDEDCGFGLVVDAAGTPLGRVTRAYQEHGVVDAAQGVDLDRLPVGHLVRVLPNHSCLTAAAHPHYHVVEGASDEVVAVWPRVNFW